MDDLRKIYPISDLNGELYDGTTSTFPVAVLATTLPREVVDTFLEGADPSTNGEGILDYAVKPEGLEAEVENVRPEVGINRSILRRLGFSKDILNENTTYVTFRLSSYDLTIDVSDLPHRERMATSKNKGLILRNEEAIEGVRRLEKLCNDYESDLVFFTGKRRGGKIYANKPVMERNKEEGKKASYVDLGRLRQSW